MALAEYLNELADLRKPIRLSKLTSLSGLTPEEQDLLDAFVLDRVDAASAPEVEALGVRPVVADTIMRGPAEKAALARVVVRAIAEARGG